MEWKRWSIAALAFFCLLPLVLAESILLDDPVTGKPVRYAGRFGAERVVVPSVFRPKAREMRGVWVATVENIDFPAHRDVDGFKRDYLTIVENLRRANFNTIIFQVRPMNDAFYPSKLNPWSRWMTGREGQGLGSFDPLAFMIEEAHRRGLEFHAWLNPYRVASGVRMRKAAYLATLDNRNFAKRNPHLVLETPAGNGRYSLILNPGEPRVVRHILDTVSEIVRSYQVDAIHFDDYFYPYTDIGAADASTFRQYNPRRLSLAAWRVGNVNNVIRGVKERLTALNRATGRKVAFGVSPFGIWGNRKTVAGGSLTGGKQSLTAQFADTRGWVKNGWVDYIVPQLYWPFSHDVAAYAALADWWADTVRGTRVNLYIGHGVYRLGTERAWRDRELADQLLYNSGKKEIDGSVFFSYRSVFSPTNAVMKRGVTKVLREFWRIPVPVPVYGNVGF